MANSVNTQRAERKLALLARYTAEFVKKALDDFAEAFRRYLLTETIAGAPGTMVIAAPGSKTVVGVDTGGLRRSYSFIEKVGPFRVLRANETVAPYAQDVAETVDFIQGRDFLRVTQFFYEKKMTANLEDEFQRMAGAANNLQAWSYRSPFPVSASSLGEGGI